MDQRWGRRTFVYLPVHVGSPGAGADADADAGIIVNISRSGALVRAALLVDCLAPVEVTIDGYVFQSLVTRIDRDGFAVEWCEALSATLQAALRNGPVARVAALPRFMDEP
jgi:hypothetical protein